MTLNKYIKRLRLNSFLLFFFPTIAILGSLLIHNYLVTLTFSQQNKYSYIKDIPGEEYYLDCTKDNKYCVKEGSEYLYEKTNKIDNCHIFKVDWIFSTNGKEYLAKELNHFVELPSTLYMSTNGLTNFVLKNEFSNSKIVLKNHVTNKKNLNCIKNYPNTYFFYKYFPPYTYLIDEKVKGIVLGSSETVNPFFYGEVSISNLVKRHPINIFFKLFLYIGVILMIAYWYNYNKIFKGIINKKVNIFYFFGLISAICLFFHVYYLGTTSTNEFLKYFRKIVIVLFILCEIFAQGLLAHKIYKNRNIFFNYCYRSIILAKLFFVRIIIVFTLMIMIILSLFNLPNTVDYILEWNYFVILLVFYLLSSIMWKKTNF